MSSDHDLYPYRADVTIVGAGFAGLTAARELTRRGYSVLVVEGRERVGGRSSTATLAGVPVDLGGTFVGPTQMEFRKLATELGCEMVPTFNEGRNLIRWGGRVRSYHGAIPRLSPFELMDIARVRLQFAMLQRSLPVREPWTAKRAKAMDSLSLSEWLYSIHASRTMRDLMALVSRVTWGGESNEVSLLHAARYAKAAGGLDGVLETEGGAQQDRFGSGTQDIAVKVATELGDRVICGAPVQRIERDEEGGVTIDWGVNRVQSKAVIVAVPPEHRSGIVFDPALPASYALLEQHWPQGKLSKAFAAYEKPFWRTRGYSGHSLSDTGPACVTYDLSPGPQGPGILMGFTDPRSFDSLSAEARREQVLDCFASLFGEQARRPIAYLDHRWGGESFAPGGPTAVVPPGSWTSYGAVLHEPIGPIHWAGTETADEWTGFIEGAIRSGKRAAAEVASSLSVTSGTCVRASVERTLS